MRITIDIHPDTHVPLLTDTLTYALYLAAVDLVEPGASEHALLRTPTGYRHVRLGVTVEHNQDV